MYELFGIKFVLTSYDIVVLSVLGVIFTISVAVSVLIKCLDYKHKVRQVKNIRK